MNNYLPRLLRRGLLLAGLPYLLLLTGCRDDRGAPIQESDSETNAFAPNNGVDSSFTFVGGQHLGEVKLRETTEDVVKALGQPVGGDAAMGRAIAIFSVPDGDTTATLTTGSTRFMPPDSTVYRVEFVRTTARKYRSPEGLGVGSTRAEVELIYPLTPLGSFTEQRDKYEVYDTDRGVGFEIGADSLVHGIVIHDRAGRAVDSSLPLYDDFIPANRGK